MSQEATFTGRLAELIKLFADNFETKPAAPFFTFVESNGRGGPPPVPRIREQNPPPGKLAQAELLREKISTVATLEKASIVLLGIAILFCLVYGTFFFSIILLCLAVPFYSAFRMIRKEHQQAADQFSQQILLDAYNTEFTAPLADRSTVAITVHFHIPRALNVFVGTSYAAPAAPHLVEQLNRVTETKLLIFTQQLTEPPARLEIEDYLNRALVQFQDDNHVDVLRVQVPLAIHIHPDKPKGVNV